MKWLQRYRHVAIAFGLNLLLLGATSKSSLAAEVDQQHFSKVVSEQQATVLSLVSGRSTPRASSPTIDVHSSGGNSQADLDPPGTWQLEASWTCFEPGTTFTLDVHGANGTLIDHISGSGTQDVTKTYPGGQHYHLEIQSSCPWHLVVKE
jgi:hypothetical protein